MVDVSRLRLANDAVVTIDAKGDPDPVIVVRIARGLKSRLRGLRPEVTATRRATHREGRGPVRDESFTATIRHRLLIPI